MWSMRLLLSVLVVAAASIVCGDVVEVSFDVGVVRAVNAAGDARG